MAITIPLFGVGTIREILKRLTSGTTAGDDIMRLMVHNYELIISFIVYAGPFSVE